MVKTKPIKQNNDLPYSAPTLEDVADMASVSTATVSRCLNDPEVVSEKTRERVLAAVDALGYSPNFGAWALSAKRTDTFGAIIPTMENAIFARGLQAFQEELERNRITLLVSSSSYSPKTEQEQIRALIARGADALLLIGHDRTEDSYRLLRRHRIPFVVAWSYDPTVDRISVGFDNFTAMVDLTTEVLKLGHRQIGVISAPREGNDRAARRCDGIFEAVKNAELSTANVEILETPYSIRNGAEAFSELMSREKRPSVVLCGNDVLAAGALQRAREMNLDVPRDVSITGFDDIELAQVLTPGLTTVHVPHRNMGRIAATQLLALRNGEKAVQSIELKVEITLRESLGPAPS